MTALRDIPSIDKLVRQLEPIDLPRPVVVAVVRRELAALRAELAAKSIPTNVDQTAQDVTARVRIALNQLRRSRIQPVINGTGVIIHTNFGRSPLGEGLIRTLAETAANYNNIEYDLSTGERGGRASYLEHNLALLCAAGAATVVNNCAAALVLILRHFASIPPKNQVLISRGELVQIGGGFRVPEILQASGAVLREVGTTNKTTIDDYREAIDERTALILKVHQSNFYMRGFVESPPSSDLARLARERGLPFVEDLGSGAVFPTESVCDRHEPTPGEVLGEGVDLVCFSGDKLFGGPQAGIIAGNANHVTALKKEPFFRALRCDKLILSALQATVDAHLSRDAGLDPFNGAQDSAGGEIPILAMMKAPVEALRARAERIVSSVAGLPVSASIGAGEAKIGGGSMPEAVIASSTVDLVPHNARLESFAARLRAAAPPVIGYISDDRFKIDLRTVFPRQDADLCTAIRHSLSVPTDRS